MLIRIVGLLIVTCVSAVCACRLGGAYRTNKPALGSPPESDQATKEWSIMAGIEAAVQCRVIAVRVSQVAWLMLSGCHVGLSPCQVLNANLTMCTRLLMCIVVASGSP